MNEGRRLKILIVIHALAGGGSERVAVELAEYFQQAGYATGILTLSGNDKDAYALTNKVQRLRLDIRRLSVTPFHTLIFALRQIVKIRTKVLSFCPDVVISLGEQNNVRVLFSMLGSGVPIIISERVHPDYHHIGWVWSLARRISYPWCASIVVQTELIRKWALSRVSQSRVMIIPNAGRSISFLEGGTGGGDEERCIVAVGRLVQQKGFDLLIRAFALSRLYQGGWRLLILGEGPQKEALNQLAAELGVSDRVCLAGFTKDVGSALSKGSIFAFTSRFEGFPNALLEAMQVGLPCIATNCPSGPSDLIDDGINGLLVGVDDVNAFALALRRLANDRKLREAFTRAALQKARKFSPEVIYPRWEQVVLSVTK